MNYKLICCALISVFLPAIAVPVLAGDGTPTGAAAEDTGGMAFAIGTQAMNEKRWSDAAKAFDTVISSPRSKRVDAAYYWKAYSLNQISHGAEATASCQTLRKKFPTSSWNADCDALSIRARAGGSGPASGTPEGGPLANADEGVRILALSALAEQDPAKAIPVIRGILMGNESLEWKKHALFALSQSRSAEATSLLEDAANGTLGANVQLQAIRTVGLFEGKRGQDVLIRIYDSTREPPLKKAIISAFMASDDSAGLVQLARKERNPELKRIIVSQLTEIHDKTAHDYLLELLK